MPKEEKILKEVKETEKASGILALKKKKEESRHEGKDTIWKNH